MGPLGGPGTPLITSGGSSDSTTSVASNYLSGAGASYGGSGGVANVSYFSDIAQQNKDTVSSTASINGNVHYHRYLSDQEENVNNGHHHRRMSTENNTEFNGGCGCTDAFFFYSIYNTQVSCPE